MFSLTTSQELAKNKILEKIIIGKKQIWFTAPTGAGKTFIIANLINNLVEYFYSEKIIFLFVSISSGSLQEQNYEKLEHYKKENLYKYNTQLIDSPSSKISNKIIQ